MIIHTLALEHSSDNGHVFPQLPNAKMQLSVQKCLMPKSSNEPGLEVADFIVSAAGSQVRRRLRGQSGHASDFKEVFCRIPIVGCWYREVVDVKVDENGVVVVSGVASPSDEHPQAPGNLHGPIRLGCC